MILKLENAERIKVVLLFALTVLLFSALVYEAKAVNNAQSHSSVIGN